jgi:hypothetical protein
VQDEEPPSENVPTGHGVIVAVVRPWVRQTNPALQNKQNPALEYVLMGHIAFPPPLQLYPPGQSPQSEGALAPVVDEYLHIRKAMRWKRIFELLLKSADSIESYQVIFMYSSKKRASW